jgi:flagellar protein FlaI
MELVSERKYAKVYDDYPWSYYEIKEPDLTKREKDLVELISKTALKKYTAEDLQMMFIKDKKKEKFVERITDLLHRVSPYTKKILSEKDETTAFKIVDTFLAENVTYVKNKEAVIHEILKELAGLSKITPLLEDDELEEIMVNGANKPVFVFDRRIGLCKTNTMFDSEEQVQDLISRISGYVSKTISEDAPLLDARLPDGSRVNATIPPASPKASTITIRKFRKIPLTITEIISNGTMTSDLASFLWVCVEGMHVSPMSLIIAGGTGSGKTTTLNSLSVFLPVRERIVTIEDTLELNLYNRENWIQLESRPAILQKGLDLNDLLKNAIRMRPDRILVGEVRGPEASTMFTAMDIGHQGLISTVHANSARETLLRLRSEPMNVPTSMFTLLDLVLMQHRMYWPRKGLIRRVTQLAEVSVMGEHVLLNDIYEFDREKDVIKRSELPSQTLLFFSRLCNSLWNSQCSSCFLYLADLCYVSCVMQMGHSKHHQFP